MRYQKGTLLRKDGNQMQYRYPSFDKLTQLCGQIAEYGALKCESGAAGAVEELTRQLGEQLAQGLAAIRALEEDPRLAETEPNELNAIRTLRDNGPRNLSAQLDKSALPHRMEGAVLGRFAACLLGVPVEGWSIAEMEALAKDCGTPFPPTQYWKAASFPYRLQYEKSPRRAYTQDGMDGVAVDDDITYTLLDLLILEKYGFSFTTEDVGEMWKQQLPIACTAEKVALDNLNAGVPALLAGETNNPYMQWIGADIRSDGWGWACAGRPELAAELAWRDAMLSHRRNGIYGEMFFAAAQAAAFTAKDPVDALRIGLTEIPNTCALYRDIQWALEEGKKITDYRQARAAVDDRFAGMHPVHTNNNACLTVFALMLGGGDYTKTVSQVVAMGMDNDCTAATAGSILGAIIGSAGIPAHWTEKFHNKVYTYMKQDPDFALDDVVARFVHLAVQAQEL